MTAPRKLHGITLKPHAKTPQQKMASLAMPAPKPVPFEVLRQVVEEHRELIERLANR